MKEILLHCPNTSRTPEGDLIKITLTDLEANTRWSGSGTTDSSEIAPNGDSCQLFSAASSLVLNNDILNSEILTLGCYIKPTSYQGQYGGSAPQAGICQFGSFSGYSLRVSCVPAASSLEPNYNVLVSSNLKIQSNSFSPINVWHHVAMSIDLINGKTSFFNNGVMAGEGNLAGTLVKTLFLGGIGDRSGFPGAEPARYGYRGHMSGLRFRKQYINSDFDPLLF